MAALDTLDPRTHDAVANSHYVAVGGTPAIIANAMNQSMAVHQNATYLIREGVLSEGLGQRAGADPAQSVSQARVLSSDLAGEISRLMGALGAGQVVSKTAGNTPPVTP